MVSLKAMRGLLRQIFNHQIFVISDSELWYCTVCQRGKHARALFNFANFWARKVGKFPGA